MRFPEHPRNAVAGRPRDPAVLPLHVCAGCGSRLVYPLGWEEAAGGRWTVSLRCPNCEWRGAGTFEPEALDALEDVLEAGARALVRDVRVLARANMVADVCRFVQALRTGAILPEDF